MTNEMVIIEQSANIPPEQKINDRIQALGPGWKVKSATTSMTPHGIATEGIAAGHCQQLYIATTVVMERVEQPQRGEPSIP